MWLNILALAVLAGCIAMGAWRGALATGLALATLLASYAASIAGGPIGGPAVGEWLEVPALVAIPVASTIAFLLAYIALAIGSRLTLRWAAQDNVGRSPRDRMLGGSFGAVRGALIALLVVYLAMWVDALRATGSTAIVPEIGDSAAANLTGEVVKSAIESAFDPGDPGARFAATVASRPATAAVELQSVIDDPNFTRLRTDAQFWGAVERGDVESALGRTSFRVLENDAQLRHRLADLGVVPDTAASDGEEFRRTIREVLVELGPRLRALRSDPALQELLEDPEIVAMVQNGNTLGLVSDPRFRELVARIGEAPR